MFRRIRQWRETRSREQEESRRKAQEEFEANLLSPQFDEIERAFGKPISQSLRSLYENQEEIRKAYVTKIVPGVPEDRWIFISCYWPLDRAQAEGGWNPDGIHFAFAGDGSGSEWVVDPTEDAAEIKYLEHETCDLKPTGVKMCEFLSLEEGDPET